MHVYAATVWLPGLGAQRVEVKADDIFRATALLKMSHPAAKVTNVRRI